VTGAVISLPSECAFTCGEAYTPMCEWASMMPGVTNRPPASMTVASSPAAGGSVPTYSMAPPRSSSAPPSMRWPAAVRTVALVMRMVGACGLTTASFGSPTSGMARA
jgi:hypothetical protein